MVSLCFIGAPGEIRTPDRLVRSYNYVLQRTVNINLLADTPVAICSALHNRAELIPAKVRHGSYIKVQHSDSATLQ